MLRKGIPLKEGVEEFLEFSGDLPVLGHNVMFDYKFMKMAAASFKYPFEKTGVDTLKVARKLLTGLENKKLKKERPATPKQKKYLENLMKYHAIGECLDIDQMTQREASKKIDHIILNYGVMKK